MVDFVGDITYNDVVVNFLSATENSKEEEKEWTISHQTITTITTIIPAGGEITEDRAETEDPAEITARRTAIFR